jgi:tetratricopeptide (TPR) repeat protein
MMASNPKPEKPETVTEAEALCHARALPLLHTVKPSGSPGTATGHAAEEANAVTEDTFFSSKCLNEASFLAGLQLLPGLQLLQGLQLPQHRSKPNAAYAPNKTAASKTQVNALTLAYGWLLVALVLQPVQRKTTQSNALLGKAITHAKTLLHHAASPAQVGSSLVQVLATSALTLLNDATEPGPTEESERLPLEALRTAYGEGSAALGFYTAFCVAQQPGQEELVLAVWENALTAFDAKALEHALLPWLLLMNLKTSSKANHGLLKQLSQRTWAAYGSTTVMLLFAGVGFHLLLEPIVEVLYQQVASRPFGSFMKTLAYHLLAPLGKPFAYTGWFNEGLVHQSQQQNNPKHQLATLQKGIAMSPYHANLHQQLGEFYLKQGNTPLALQSLEQLLDCAPKLHHRRLELAELCLQQNVAFKALYHSKLVLNSLPKSAEAAWLAAQSLEKLEDFEGAIALGHNALEWGPNTEWLLPVLQRLAQWYYTHKNDYQSCVALMRFALHLSANNPQLVAQLAEYHSEQGDYQAAITLYKELLNHYPENPDLYTFMGYLLWQMHHNEEAKVAYEHALRLKPENAIAHNNLGVIFLDSLSDPAQAMLHFKEALQQNPSYAMAAFNLGRSLQATHQQSEARTLFCKAMQLNQSSNELPDAELEERLLEVFSV